MACWPVLRREPMSKRWLLALALLAALADVAHAHGFAIYVSTPVSPPQGFEWVFFLSMPLVAVLGALAMRRIESSWGGAALKSVVATALFAFVFYRIGRWAAEATTGPPPGLGWGCRPCYGFGWQQVGDLFLEWNTFGLLLLAFTMFLASSATGVRVHFRAFAGVGLVLLSLLGVRSQINGMLGGIVFPCGVILVCLVGGAIWRPKALPLILVSAIAYCGCLAPFLATRAYTHGWAGSYSAAQCEERIAALTVAPLRFAQAHGGKLPAGNDIGAILEQVRPYLELAYEVGEKDVTICPVGAAYETRPQPFRWNSGMSGRPLAEFWATFDHEDLVICEYANRGDHREYMWELTKGRIRESLRRQEAPRQAGPER
jgi:hypothetical protein